MALTLEDLRNHLFDVLAALRDPNNPMSIERAKAISEIAQTVINSAKVEVDYVRVIGKEDVTLPVFSLTDGTKADALPSGVTGIRTHRIR